VPETVPVLFSRIALSGFSAQWFSVKAEKVELLVDVVSRISHDASRRKPRFKVYKRDKKRIHIFI